MEREKARRGDHQLAEREPHTDGLDQLDPAVRDRASAIWRRIADATRAEAAPEVDATARGGLADPAHELPYRAELEAQVGVDLSGVRAHSGPNAQRAANQLGAEAFTVDGASAFGTEQPAKDLVAHELVHALQARGGATASRDTDEQEASAVGARLEAGERIDPRALAGGARGVRKREKSPSQALSELIAQLATAELSSRDDGLRVADASTTTVDDSVEGERTETASKLTVDGRRGISIASEETTTTGAFAAPRTAEQVAAERDRVRSTIADAKSQLLVETMLGTTEAISLRVRAQRLDDEAARLDVFEPALAEGKRGVLAREAATARAKADAIEAEMKARDKLIATLDEGLADLDGRHDAWQVASELAKAELAFRPKIKVTKKQSLGLDALKGELSRERGITTTETDESGAKISNSSSSSQKLGIKQGLRGEATEKRGHKLEDADGNVLHGDETTATARAGIVADKDGATGLDGGAKISRALEQSGHKATAGAAFNGSVKVNVIALPRATPEAEQLFSVVVTINLALALELGLAKSRTRKSGNGVEGKGTIAVDADVTAAGQLTHTHVLDAAAAASYLDTLERAGAGDKQAAKQAPEFGMLQKALAGGSSLDDVAGAATATIGSAEAAAALGVDESVELTLSAGGSLDVALSAQRGDDASVGVSRGVSGELVRTLKVARAAGKPEQQLVDVTVMFGDKSDQHGALSASALGVSVSAGQKEWGGGSSAVTFRLDASEPDYADLYQQIVHTTSRASLAELRLSPAFRAHVRSYTDKAERGGEHSLGIKGHLGVATKDSWSRTSSTTVGANGELTIEDTGSSTTSTGFSVGPLELLRRTQAATATVESRDGDTVVDLAEQVDHRALGGFEIPTWHEVLAADSPVKALEEALVENRRTLAGYLLDPDDLKVLASRAKDRDRWSRVPLDAKVLTLPTDADYATWETLRGELVSPRDGEFGLDQLELGREVARGRAIADFMAALGKGKGVRYLQRVLREWGHGEDAGVAYEFPAGIKPEAYIDLRFELRRCERDVATMLPDEGIAHCAELELEVAKLLDKLQRAEFQSERPRAEMIGELRELAIGVAAQRRRLEGSTGEAEVHADAATAVHHREEIVIASKLGEVRLLQRCETIMRDDLRAAAKSEQLEPILIEGGELDEIYEQHVANIKTLRATYRAAGTPEADWLVSVDVHDDARTYDVEMDRALEALWAYYSGKPLGLGVAGYEPRRQRWNARYWSY